MKVKMSNGKVKDLKPPIAKAAIKAGIAEEIKPVKKKSEKSEKKDKEDKKEIKNKSKK